MRIVVLGGSGSSTPELLEAVARWPGGLDRRPPLEIVLVGRSAEKLELVAAAARSRVPADGPPVEVRTETDRRAALAGADIVLNQVRIGGYAARAFDESFPREAGLPGEETMGPGGLANALRTVPALRAIWADVATLAPGALVVNLTNPAGIVHAAARRFGVLNVVSVCDAPLPMLGAVAAALERPIRDVVVRYAGLNHVGWYVPEAPSELAKLRGVGRGVDDRVTTFFGGVPGPYVRYYLHPDRVLAEQSTRNGTRGQELQRIEADLLTLYAAGPDEEPPERRAVWYALIVLPVIDAWLNGSSEPLILGVTNDGMLTEVPRRVTVEVPHDATRPRSFVPLGVVTRPPLLALQFAAHGYFEELAVLATEPNAGRDDRVRALLANPMVRSVEQALRLDDLIETSPFNDKSEVVAA